MGAGRNAVPLAAFAVLLGALACNSSPASGDGGSDAGPEAGSGPALITGAVAESALGCSGSSTFWIRPDSGGGDAGANEGTTSDWSVRLGAEQDDRALDVAARPDGTTFLLSGHLGSVDFGGGPVAVPPGCGDLVSSFSASGAFRWSRSIASWPVSVAAGPDGGVFLVLDAGVAAGIASLAPDGSARWLWNGGVHAVSPVVATADAEFVALQGAYENGAYPITIQRLSSEGIPVSGFTFSTSGAVVFAASSTDEVIFATWFSQSQTIGDQTFQTVGGSDVVVGKLDSDGKVAWVRQFGSPDEDRVAGVALSPDGTIVLLGFGGGALDFGSGPLGTTDTGVDFLVRLDGEGAPVSSRALATTWFGSWIRALPSGEILVADSFDHPITVAGVPVHTGAPGDQDFLLVQLSSAFELERLWQFGNGGGMQKLSGLAIDGQGAMRLAGAFQGKLDLGSGLMRSAGSFDVFLGSVKP